VVLGGTPYSYFRYESHLAALNAVTVYEEASESFAEVFGRRHEAVEAYRCDDADIVLLMIGSFATKAREAIDRLRDAGQTVGLLRPRLLRPFPAEKLQQLLAGKKGVAVIDQNISMGMGGVLHAELAGALYGKADAPAVLASFIGGLGGRDISAEEFYEIVSVTRQAVDEGITPPPRMLFTRDEHREIRKFQAIAHAERDELESGS
jgi:pyruvate ferredoxin oxidoreductase alpha subunit